MCSAFLVLVRILAAAFWMTCSCLMVFSGRRALTGGGGRAGSTGFGGCGACHFLVDIWGLAVKECENLVPAYTSSSIFCEKLRSGDAGERDNVSGEMGSGSGVSGGCNMLSWLPWLFSRKSMLM